MTKIELSERLSSVEEYYFSKKLKEIAAVRASGKDVISLAIGSPDLPPHEVVRRELASTAKSPDTHGYQQHNGTPALRQAFADFYRLRYKTTLDPTSEILPLLGSKEGILHITMAFTNPGDSILAPNPGYGAYTNVAKMLGVNPISYNLTEEGGWQPDIAELRRHMEAKRVKILWVNYPHMPTGVEPRWGLFVELAELCVEYNVVLVNDNPYSLVLPTDSSNPVSIFPQIEGVEGAKGRVIELNSLSKSHCMPGWRVGAALGAAELLKAVLQVKSNFDSGMFLAVQNAAVAALKAVPPTFFLEVNAEYSARRKVVWRILSSLSCQVDKHQVGMFVWARAPDDWACVRTELDALFQETYVFITPGFIFGSNGDRYVRVSLCCKLERLKEAEVRVQAYARQRGGGGRGKL